MTPISISVSDITYVDFRKKKILGESILPFDKVELLREGLICYSRLIRRGQVRLVNESDYDKTG
jgi:hypothetical protein